MYHNLFIKLLITILLFSDIIKEIIYEPLIMYGVWRIPITDNEQNETSKARMLVKIHERLPRYFTRQTQKNMLNNVM